MAKKALSAAKKKYVAAKNEGNLRLADELIKRMSFLDTTGTKIFCGLMAKRKVDQQWIHTTYRELEKMSGRGHGGMSRLAVNAVIDQLMNLRMEFTLPAKYLDNWRDRVDSDTPICIKGCIITSCEHDPRSEQLEIFINSRFVPLFDDINSRYTWLFLEDLASIQRSEYGARLYQWLRMHKPSKGDFCDFVWHIDGESEKEPSIRQFLGIPKSKYTRTRDFYRYVVAASFDKLNECLSQKFHIDFEPSYRKNARGQAIVGVKINRVTWVNLDEKVQKKRPLPSEADVFEAPAVDRAEATVIAEKCIAYINRANGTKFSVSKKTIDAIAGHMLDGMGEVEILSAVHHYLSSNGRPDQAVWRTPARIFSAKNFEELGQLPVSTTYGRLPWETDEAQGSSTVKPESSIDQLLQVYGADAILLKFGRQDVPYQRDRQSVLDALPSIGDTDRIAKVLSDLREIDAQIEAILAAAAPAPVPVEVAAGGADPDDDLPF